MTNYHTVTPGVQGESDETNINGQTGKSSFTQGVNQQKSSASHRGTKVPGMENHTYPGSDNYQQPQGSNKPIVGFLVSVSRTEEGEFWLLRQGQNIIGSGFNCNVILSESSVSEEHAILTVHRNPGDNNRLNVGIMDKASSNGTFVNEEYIGFNPRQCKNFDKLKIGNYELLLMLFDAVNFGLKKSENFISKNDFDYSDPGNFSNGTQL
jgi:pSer/pThr/pTyr-binding forkhead associated (FHA) protein